MIVLSPTGDSYDVAECVESVGVRPVEGRSSQWPKLEKATIEKQPYCTCCRIKLDLQVHHCEPFHIAPEKELDPSNLIVLCRRCHLLLGHLGNWTSWNTEVRKDVSVWNNKILHRPKG